MGRFESRAISHVVGKCKWNSDVAGFESRAISQVVGGSERKPCFSLKVKSITSQTRENPRIIFPKRKWEKGKGKRRKITASETTQAKIYIKGRYQPEIRWKEEVGRRRMEGGKEQNICTKRRKKRKQVHSENDASEVDILGHFGIFWDNSETFLTSLEHLDCLPSHFRPFVPVIGPLKKTDDRTDGRTDLLIEMRGRI